jgi:hypothetical protein
MATATTGYTWVSGNTVLPGLLNQMVNSATITLSNDEVTTAKILDANVTNAKLASGIDASKLTTGTLPIARIADAAVTPAKLSQPLTLETAKATSSGTSVEFTAIPSWVKRITMMLNGVSTTGTNSILIQLGTSAGYQTSGYGGAVLVSQGGAVGSVAHSTGFLVDSTTLATDTRSGIAGFNFVGTSNVWSAAGNVSLTATARNSVFSGTVLLAGTLDRIRITTADTFDAGSVNIMYEG